jgi:Arc/MetJ-type ribon-helix-helix transcriptional regulator
MTVHLPEELANSIRTELVKGQFANEDELVAAAVREYLRRHGQTGQLDNGSAGECPGKAPEQELQRRLFEAGLLSEIKPPITDFTPYLNRQAVPIQGEPLSETILGERR